MKPELFRPCLTMEHIIFTGIPRINVLTATVFPSISNLQRLRATLRSTSYRFVLRDRTKGNYLQR